MDSNTALPIFVETFVPLVIADLSARGGPSNEDFVRMQAFLPRLCAEGDALLFRTKNKTGELAGELLHAIAVLAFQPGGISVFGQHWEATP